MVLLPDGDLSRSPLSPRVLCLHLRWLVALFATIVLSNLLPGTVSAQTHHHGAAFQTAQTDTSDTAQAAANPPAQPADAAAASSYHNPTTFTLRTGIAEGRMVYIGVGGAIDKQIN